MLLADALQVLMPPRDFSTFDDVGQVVDDFATGGAADEIERYLGSSFRPHLPFVARAIAELCQNVVEHADAPGWLSIWVPQPPDIPGRDEIAIAVADAGQGFTGSLGIRHSCEALTAAVIRKRSRCADPGRGQGISSVLSFIARCGGRIQFRSGTAGILALDAEPPDTNVKCDLVYRPGVQALMLIPAAEE